MTAVAGPNHGDPTELELDDDPEQCARLDVSRVPLVATVARFGTRNVVDATRDESALGDYALAVAVDKGNVRGVSTMSTSDGKSVDVSSLRAMTKAARDVARRMHAATDASSSPPSREPKTRKTTKTTARSATTRGSSDFLKSIF